MGLVIIVLRIIHIVGGTFWVGSAVALAFFVEPAVASAGAAGNQLMQRIGQSAYGPIVSVASILTILAGLALFVLQGYSLASGSGFTFGLGGLAGIISLALGGIAGPTSARLRRLGAEIQSGGKPPTAEQAQQLQAYQTRLTQTGRVAAVLAFAAAILMSFARYV